MHQRTHIMQSICRRYSPNHITSLLRRSPSPPTARRLFSWRLAKNVASAREYRQNRHHGIPQPKPPTTVPTGHYLEQSPTERGQAAARHLGVIIQADLRWTAHVDSVIGKAKKSLHLLHRLRSTLNTQALIALYKTYIRPTLEYASMAITPLSQTSSDSLERFQRRAVKLSLHLPIFSHLPHSVLLHRADVSTLSSRRFIKHSMLAHKIHHNYAPPHLQQVNLNPLTEIPYNLRHARSYHIPTSRTDRHKMSPINIALHHFNSIPLHLRTQPNREIFKKEITNLFLNSICSCSAHQGSTP